MTARSINLIIFKIYKIPLMSIMQSYKSSFYFTTLTPFTPEDYRKASHIINHIIDNPQSIDFRQPVDWQGMGLMDYPELIKYPMDLGTVKSKLDEEAYAHIEEFLDDFGLIWDNCKSYNIKGTWIYALADKLEKNGKKMLKNYFPHVPIQSQKSLNQPFAAPKAPSKSKKSESKSQTSKLFYEDQQEITLSQKQHLADSFKNFSPTQNKDLVEYIQSVCPTAFRQVQNQVQIIVDHMDILTFKQVMKQINKYVEKYQKSRMMRMVSLPSSESNRIDIYRGMSRQIMKDLQYRAQLLLQASSEQQDEINAYTASPSRSRPAPRINLNTLINSHESDSDDQASNLNKPDIELLKKCIALTNENNQLKALTNQQQNKIDKLEILIQQLSQAENRLKQQFRNRQESFKQVGWQEGQLQKQMAGVRMENLQLKQQIKTLRSLNSQLQKQLSSNKMRREEKLALESEQIATRNDYTIKFKNKKPPTDLSTLQQQYQAQITRVQGQLRSEKSKTQKLCQFINLELPKLQNVIQELTLKLELRVDKYLLRDSSHP